MQNAKKKKQAKKSMRKTAVIIGIAGVLILAGVLIFSGQSQGKRSVAGIPVPAASSGNGSAPSGTGSAATGINKAGIVIRKSDITKTAAFYPYRSGKIDMEVIAVKAPDGTIRTALNTCQVCYDSGAGYYVQEGDELVCQNCGNRFNISKIEKLKNGCNPIPILSSDKTDNGDTITITGELLDQYKDFFKNWKT